MQLAIVGLGAWGRRLVDAAQDKSDRVRFVSAVARRPDSVKEFADAKGVRVTSELSEVLADPAVQGIVSCGPAHLHAEHSMAALKAGKPVLAIKPMALALGDAVALRAAAEASGVLLALGYNRCFMPHVAALRDLLREETLGTILHTEGDFCANRFFQIKDGDWKADPDHSRAGSLADHPLYLTIETLGPMVDVQAIARSNVSPNRLADVTAVMARSEAGATAFLTAIGTTADFFRFQVFGTKGWAELRGNSTFRLETTDGRKVDTILPAVDAELVQLEAFVDAIEGRAAFPVSPADAVHGVAVLDAIARSAFDGRTVRVDQTL
ncbi:MAG: hypothetical protein JWO28_2218 [Hyphomicrobiales bacterium]|jgi:predicted dehydrogenase|nr:hypothetical protein [Hyphomicrobiales bacterium]